ncbi:MAG TPA: sensor histidine kinase [Ktedonobacterales bacterium]|nr:sensor histidine kinase [Ktedonobacterales bacterium]
MRQTYPSAQRMPWVIAQLLRFPLFYKVLIANSLLVALGAIVGTRLAVSIASDIDRHGTALVILFCLIGVAVTITLNTVLLRAALQPVRALRLTVNALEHGDFAVRVPESPLADADLANVSRMLNQILDNLQRYQERVQDLSASVLQAQEDERHRIARELHDQIGQSLTLLLVRLKLLEAAPASSTVRGDLIELRGAVAAAIDQVRKLALDLRPPALDQLGLIAAIRTLVREFAEQTRVAATCEAPADAVEVGPERATAIYRIIQEALTNIAKHADAHNVRVVLERRPYDITIAVSDDGRGFDLRVIQECERDQEGPGLGIFGMEERARLLGGTYSIKTRPGVGTTVIATIPMNPLEPIHGPTADDPAGTTTAAYSHLAR